MSCYRIDWSFLCGIALCGRMWNLTKATNCKGGKQTDLHSDWVENRLPAMERKLCCLETLPLDTFCWRRLYKRWRVGSEHGDLSSNWGADGLNILRLLCDEELTTKTTHCLWENLHKVQLIKSNIQRVFFCDHKKFSGNGAKCKMTTRATVVSPAHQSETNAFMQIYVAQFNQLPRRFFC